MGAGGVCVWASEPELRFSGNSSGSKEALSEGLRAPKRGPLRKSARMRFSATAGEEAKKPKTTYVPAEIGRAPCCYDWSGGRLGQMQ